MSICLWAELQFVRLAADLSRTFFVGVVFFHCQPSMIWRLNEMNVEMQRERKCVRVENPVRGRDFEVATNNAICFY